MLNFFATTHGKGKIYEIEGRTKSVQQNMMSELKDQLTGQNVEESAVITKHMEKKNIQFIGEGEI